MKRERWLVLNKLDLLPESERDARCQELVSSLGWKGPVFYISAITKTGTRELCGRIMEYLEQQEDESAA